MRFRGRVLVAACGASALAGTVALWTWWGTSSPLPRRQRPAVNLPVENPFVGDFSTTEAFPGIEFDRPVVVVQQTTQPGRYFVAQQGGLVRAIALGPPHRTDVTLDLSSRLVDRSEAGLVGLALHPDFGNETSANGRFLYVFYVAKAGDRMYDRLSRFSVDPATAIADPASELVLIDQLDEDTDHNGGDLQFGPDGYLYVGVGDEGGIGDPFQNGQRIDTDLFSGILRIDVDCRPVASAGIRRQPKTGRTQGYCIPKDNPFVGVPNALEEFWAIGLRNPHRFSFDGDKLWGGDVGQDRREEVFFASRASNHQWSYAEGSMAFTESPLGGRRVTPLRGVEATPVFEYPHTNENGAIVGGYVYRGTQLPELAGRYVFGDYNSGRIWALEVPSFFGSSSVTRLEALLRLPPDRRIASFGRDRDGELLLCGYGKRSTILRLRGATNDSGTR